MKKNHYSISSFSKPIVYKVPTAFEDIKMRYYIKHTSTRKIVLSKIPFFNGVKLSILQASSQ